MEYILIILSSYFIYYFFIVFSWKSYPSYWKKRGKSK